MGSLVQVNIGVAAVSIAYCLNEARKLQLFNVVVSPASLLNQPTNLRIALAAAGSSTIFLGLSLLERTFFREDSTGSQSFSLVSVLEECNKFAAKFRNFLVHITSLYDLLESKLAAVLFVSICDHSSCVFICVHTQYVKSCTISRRASLYFPS